MKFPLTFWGEGGAGGSGGWSGFQNISPYYIDPPLELKIK